MAEERAHLEVDKTGVRVLMSRNIALQICNPN